LFLLAVLLVPLLAACGSPDTDTTSGIISPAGQDEGNADTAIQPTPPPTEVQVETEMPPAVATASGTTTGTAAGGTGGKKLKIGMVTDIAKLGDKSFNDLAWTGVQAGARAIGGTTKVIETTDPNDYEKNIDQLVSENYDVIVTVGSNLGKQTIAAANANPNIKFIGVDQEQAVGKEVPNLAGLIFEEDKAGFLAGALAASYSKSGKLGAVLGTDAIPAEWRYGEGYRAGAKYIKNDINVQMAYHSDVGFDKTVNDPEWGKATALSMLDKGVDVVFGAGGRTGNGALLAAADRKDKGTVAIGADVDRYNTVPEARPVLLSSTMKLIDQGVAGLIKAVADGSITSGNHVGKVGLAPFHDLDSKVPHDMKSKLEQIRKQLDDGSLKTNVPATKPKS
jgi:basic membrane protein A